MRIVAFSKDRACQLDLTLRSLAEQVTTPHELSVAVLYLASSSDYQRGYDQLAAMHPAVGMCRQDAGQSVKTQIRRLIDEQEREFFCFLLDDMVVVRPFGWADPEFAVLRRRPEVASLSLRLYPGITYCQPLDLATRPPPLDADRTWDWRYPRGRAARWLARLTGGYSPAGDWAGSMFLDGYVFRHRQFMDYFARLPELPFVTKLEQVMLEQPLPGTRVACYAQSRVVNVALNKVGVNSVYPSAGGSVEELNRRFLAGGRLEYGHLKDTDNRACHLTMPPRWLP